MKTSDPENTTGFFLRYKPGRRFYVFIISLFLASGFWVLNALNKNYSEAVTIQIKYINLKENRAFSTFPTSNLVVNISGDGYSLLQLRNSAEEDTIVVDLEDLKFRNEGDKKRTKISTNVITNQLKQELNNNVTINRVSKDSIEIITEIGSNKEVEVTPNYSLSLKKGIVLKKPVYTEPGFVDVRGPISAMKSLNQITTEHLILEEISEYTEIEVDLAYNKDVFQSEFTKVKIIADVESLTEGEIEVPIHISGVPENKRVRLLPNKVTVKYSTGLSHYDLIKPELFDLIIKYEDVIKDGSKIPVYLRAVPSYVNVIQFHPEQVGYLKMDVVEK